MSESPESTPSPETASAPAADSGPPAATDEKRARAGRTRTVVSGFLGVLAIVGLFASTFAVWGHGVLFNEDKVAGAVNKAMDNPAVTDAMAAYITNQVFVAIDVEGKVSSVLPRVLQPLASGIVGGAQSAVESQVANLLETDVARNLVTDLARRSHRGLMRLLEGEGLVAGVTIKNGQVTLNLLPLVGLGLKAAQGLGVLDNLAIPELTRDGDPQAQIASLEKAFNRDLPDNFGQLVVFKTDVVANGGETLATAQRMTVLVKRAIWLILALTVVFIAGSIGFARKRRRALVALGIGGAAAFLLGRILIQQTIDRAPNLVVNPGAREAVSTTVQDVAGGLLRLVTSMLLVGLLTAVIAFITGTSERAVSMRKGMGQGNQSLQGIVASHREGSAFVLLGGAMLVLFIAGIGIFSIVVAVLLCAAGGWALWGNLGTPAEPTPADATSND